MKLREGLVSNSSSSSFICDVCGEVISGWDMSYEEAEFVCCKNGHEFCENHLLGENTLDILSDDEREDYDEEWRYYVPAEFCPVCQMKNIINSDKIKFLKKVCGMSDEDIIREIQSRFKSYDEFVEYIKK